MNKKEFFYNYKDSSTGQNLYRALLQCSQTEENLEVKDRFFSPKPIGNNCFDGDFPPDIIMPKTQGPLHIKLNMKNFAKFPLLSKEFVAEIYQEKKEKRSKSRSRSRSRKRERSRSRSRSRNKSSRSNKKRRNGKKK